MSDLDFNILKVLTTNSAKAIDFAFNCDANMFSKDHRDDAKMIVDFVKSYRSIPTKRTLIDRFANSPDSLERINKLWDDLENHKYNPNEYKYDLERMRERYKGRCVKSISHSLNEKMSEGQDPDTILKDLSLRMQKASSVNAARTHIQKSVGSYTEEFRNRYDARKNPDVETPEIKTGYSMLDSVTGGISPAELWMIGGETNSGKSMLLSNMAAQIWMQGNTVDTPPEEYKRGYNVLYFSLEMPYDDCYDRLLARVADIPQRSIKDASLDSEQTERMEKALKFVENYQKSGYYFNIVDVPRNVTIEEVELRFQDALLEFRPDIVIVDYMGIMHDSNNPKEQDWLKMGNIAASLHEFSRAYDVAMLTAVQLTDIKRGSKSKGDQEEHQRVGVHRIGRSSQIATHVNVAIQIETRLNERNLPDLKYHVIKNRKGPIGQGHMVKNFECASLYDVPHIEEDNSNNVSDNIEDLIKQIRENNEQQ